MEKSKFHDIRKISHILGPFKCSMDELPKDLSNALEESSDFRHHDTKMKRSKNWKCRSKAKSGMIYNNIKHSTKSEDSDSSLDNCTYQDMDISRKGSHYTDSDDILCKSNLSWRHYSTNLGESDSLNENLHPLREPRRKRKFKRMSVDPPSVTEPKIASLSDIPFCSQKRLSPKVQCTVSQLSAEMESICKDFGNPSTGKRKRCAHDRNIEFNGCECVHRHEMSNTQNHHHLAGVTSDLYDVYHSELSSGESDCGLLTNDESREADDEQSDFFQESGPSYGIPNLLASRFWYPADFERPVSPISDKDFKDFKFLLTKSFQHMSKPGEKMYSMQVEKYKDGRQITSGRRRLGKTTPKVYQKMICPDELPIASANVFGGFNLENGVSKITPNEKKKRKGMPPLTGNIHGLGEASSRIPESNIGLQALKQMGWKPGTGLGRGGAGIVSPIRPSCHKGKLGLGFPSPPPPPSSPENL